MKGEASFLQRVQEFFRELRLAGGFLTILPLLPADAVDSSTVAGSLRWLPILGCLIGAAGAAFDYLADQLFGSAIAAVLTIGALSILTGAIHLDGLADTADALGARGDRKRALEIMRDSSIGSFGAIALCLVLAVKIIALASIAGGRQAQAIYVALGASRWAQVGVAARLDYLRAEGAGSVILRGGRNAIGVASIVFMIALLPVLSFRTVEALLLTILTVFLMRATYLHWLGGVTGDLIGACSEIVEIVVLLTFT